jgi:hypothetical protein
MLNCGIARAMNNDEWGNAYAQNKLPDSLSGFGEAVEAAFGRKLLEQHRRKQDSTSSTELTTGETSMSTSMETSDSKTFQEG